MVRYREAFTSSEKQTMKKLSSQEGEKKFRGVPVKIEQMSTTRNTEEFQRQLVDLEMKTQLIMWSCSEQTCYAMKPTI